MLKRRLSVGQTGRHSGIELLKIIAIFIIVISHVVQTLTSQNLEINYQAFVIDISKATTDIQIIVLLILWVTIYFIIAYMRKYLILYADSVKLNVFLFGLNAIAFVGLIVFTEFAGLHISFLNEKMMHWASNCNPFLILCLFLCLI